MCPAKSVLVHEPVQRRTVDRREPRCLRDIAERAFQHVGQIRFLETSENGVLRLVIAVFDDR